MSGKVFLVGAGPGDPDLLTIKAARVLREADVVLHDDLVSAEILRLVPPPSWLHNVGKRVGRKTITQDQINQWMIGLAHSGLKVVRLKSGDPAIFGRLGEEISALRQAEVEFEIVPGITAALGAASTSLVSLTHRRDSHAVVLLTGQLADGAKQPNWEALAALRATLVVYMPGNDYAAISRRLLSSGFTPDLPCAVVSRATTEQQQVHRTTLRDLARAPFLPAPTLLMIGEVLRQAGDAFVTESLNQWVSAGPGPNPDILFQVSPMQEQP
jgi:uroporphyrin-III C-methyltransferase